MTIPSSDHAFGAHHGVLAALRTAFAALRVEDRAVADMITGLHVSGFGAPEDGFDFVATLRSGDAVRLRAPESRLHLPEGWQLDQDVFDRLAASLARRDEAFRSAHATHSCDILRCGAAADYYAPIAYHVRFVAGGHYVRTDVLEPVVSRLAAVAGAFADGTRCLLAADAAYPMSAHERLAMAESRRHFGTEEALLDTMRGITGDHLLVMRRAGDAALLLTVDSIHPIELALIAAVPIAGSTR